MMIASFSVRAVIHSHAIAPLFINMHRVARGSKCKIVNAFTVGCRS